MEVELDCLMSIVGFGFLLLVIHIVGLDFQFGVVLWSKKKKKILQKKKKKGTRQSNAE